MHYIHTHTLLCDCCPICRPARGDDDFRVHTSCHRSCSGQRPGNALHARVAFVVAAHRGAGTARRAAARAPRSECRAITRPFLSLLSRRVSDNAFSRARAYYNKTGKKKSPLRRRYYRPLWIIFESSARAGVPP